MGADPCSQHLFYAHYIRSPDVCQGSGFLLPGTEGAAGKIKMELCWLGKDGLVTAVVYKTSKNTVQMDRFLKFASHPTMYILKIAQNHAKRPKERLQSQKIPV